MHGVEIEPKVGCVRRLLNLVVLIAYAIDYDLEKVGVREWHIVKMRFENAEGGESHDPVVENTVFHPVLVEAGENIVQCEVESLKEPLLENAPQFEKRQKEMSVAMQHHFRERLEVLLFLTRERRLRIHQMYAAREDGLVFGFVLPCQDNSRSDRDSDRHTVLHLASRRTAPQAFEDIDALRH